MVAIVEPVELVKVSIGAGEVLAAGVGHGDFAGDGQPGGRAAAEKQALPAVGRAVGGRGGAVQAAADIQPAVAVEGVVLAAEAARAAAGEELAGTELPRGHVEGQAVRRGQRDRGDGISIQQDRHGIGAAASIRHHHVGFAVAVEVARGHGIRPGAPC